MLYIFNFPPHTAFDISDLHRPSVFLHIPPIFLVGHLIFLDGHQIKKMQKIWCLEKKYLFFSYAVMAVRVKTDGVSLSLENISDRSALKEANPIVIHKTV